jgi:hypothetical protein
MITSMLSSGQWINGRENVVCPARRQRKTKRIILSIIQPYDNTKCEGELYHPARWHQCFHQPDDNINIIIQPDDQAVLSSSQMMKSMLSSSQMMKSMLSSSPVRSLMLSSLHMTVVWSKFYINLLYWNITSFIWPGPRWCTVLCKIID